MDIAKQSYVIPLSILFCRQHNAIMNHYFKIGNEIPLWLSPPKYQNLLPVTTRFSLFMCVQKNGVILPPKLRTY
jgi:hypothetical protein